MFRAARRVVPLINKQSCGLAYRRCTTTFDPKEGEWEKNDPEFEGHEFEVGMDPDEELGPDAIVGGGFKAFPSPNLYPAAREAARCPDLKTLVDSVARVYPTYGEYVKCPSAISIGRRAFITSYNGVADTIWRHGGRLQRDGTPFPFTFDSNARHFGESIRVGTMKDRCWLHTDPPSGPLDMCPAPINVPWESPSLTAGTDVAVLGRTLATETYLSVSDKPIQPSEDIILCAYCRFFVSVSQAKQWLSRASVEQIANFGIRESERNDLLRHADRDVLRRRVATPLSLRLDRAADSQTKIISYGKIQQVGNGLAICDADSNTGSSGGAYVRKSDPTKLVGIHLGLPARSPKELGNFNVFLTVQHPTVQCMLETAQSLSHLKPLVGFWSSQSQLVS